jgi:hypothetical protein
MRGIAVMVVPVRGMVVEDPTEERRGDVPALQDVEARLVRTRCGTGSHGFPLV